MTKNWQAKRLVEVATLQRGFDLPTQNRVAGQFPLISSSGISDTHDKCAVKGPGVVTGRSGSIGNVFFVEDDFWPLNTVLYVKDFHGNDPRFVYYLLKKFDLQRFASGTGVPTLNRNFVHDEMVSAPSLSEQRRIVAVLDKTFEQIHTAKTNTKKSLQLSGDAFETYRDAVFLSNRKIPMIPLREIAEFRNGVNFTKSSRGKTIQIVGVGDFHNRFVVPTEDLESVTIDGEVNEDDLLRAGDLLTVRSNGNVALIGRTMLADNIILSMLHSGFTIRTRLLRKDIFPKYVCHFMRSGGARREMIEGGTGINIKSLNQGTMGNLKLPLPSYEKQIAIASDMDEFSVETKRLEQIYKQKLRSFEDLQRTLLHQAFSGNL